MFTDHPRSLGMSWASHGAGAVKIGAELIGAGCAASIVHAIVPGWFTETAGRTVFRLHDHMEKRKAGAKIRTNGRIMRSDRRCRSRSSVADFRGPWLQHSLRAGLDAVLIDGSGRAGHGVAYSTREPAHVLNVRAEVMSAWPEDLEHFVRLVEEEGGTRHDFVERRQFGRYLKAILEEGMATGRLRLVEKQATSAEPGEDGWSVSLETAASSRQALVLAIGNQQPEPMPFRERQRSLDQQSVGCRGAGGGRGPRGE